MATRRPFGLPLAVAFVLGAGMLAFEPPPAAAGPTASQLEASLLTMINRARAGRNLRPLYRDARVADLARDRASTLAAKNVLSHSAAGNLGAQLENRRIQWYMFGENLGWATGWGSATISRLFSMWKNSSSHWRLLMSDRFNYIGVGLAYRSSSNVSYGSIVLTESIDHTRPAARMLSVSRSGSKVRWTWSAWDRRLQTRTAGLRDIDVQYRAGWGSWRTIRDNTTTTALTLTGRPSGQSYAVRVRARDRRGYLSTWTAELRVYVP